MSNALVVNLGIQSEVKNSATFLAINGSLHGRADHILSKTDQSTKENKRSEAERFMIKKSGFHYVRWGIRFIKSWVGLEGMLGLFVKLAAKIPKSPLL